MENAKMIQGSIEINAPKQKVWDVLFNDSYNRQWYAEFSEGTYAITDWLVGSKAIFIDKANSGLIGKVLVNKPAEELILEYEGVVTNGLEVYDSDEAMSVKGGKEKYFLAGTNELTRLSIECDMHKNYFEFMTAAWNKALLKIKTLSESR